MTVSPWYTPPTTMAWSRFQTDSVVQPHTGLAVAEDDNVSGYWAAIIAGTATYQTTSGAFASLSASTFPPPDEGIRRWQLGQQVNSAPMRAAWDPTYVFGDTQGGMPPYYFDYLPGFEPPPSGFLYVEYEGFDVDDPAAGTLVDGGAQKARVRINSSDTGTPPDEPSKVFQLVSGDTGLTETSETFGAAPYLSGASAWQTKALLDSLEGAGRLLDESTPFTLETVEVALPVPIDPSGTAQFLQTAGASQQSSNPYVGQPDFTLLFNVGTGVELGIEYQGPRYRFVTDGPARIAPLRYGQRDDGVRQGRSSSRQASTRQGWRNTYQ